MDEAGLTFKPYRLLMLKGILKMIPRYSRPAMTQIWEPENKFRIWFEIEAHACDAQAKLGIIPEDAAKRVWERGKFDVERIDEIGATNEYRNLLIK